MEQYISGERPIVAARRRGVSTAGDDGAVTGGTGDVDDTSSGAAAAAHAAAPPGDEAARTRDVAGVRRLLGHALFVAVQHAVADGSVSLAEPDSVVSRDMVQVRWYPQRRVPSRLCCDEAAFERHVRWCRACQVYGTPPHIKCDGSSNIAVLLSGRDMATRARNADAIVGAALRLFNASGKCRCPPLAITAPVASA